MRNRLGILITCVVIVHLAFFFFDFTEKKPPPPKKSLIVNTYTPPPPPPPRPKPTPPKPTPKVQSSPKVVKSTIPNKNSQVLKELGETLAKIEAKQQEIEKTAPISLPKSIDFLQIDTEEKVEEQEYLLLLAGSLKEALELPEVGKVKLELTVLNSGQVQKVRVLSTESEKNRRYLENQLLHLMFPSFTGELKKEKAHTFALTFCNEK